MIVSFIKSRGPILRMTSSETRSVCVKQALNTCSWLVNALVTWQVSYKITTLVSVLQNTPSQYPKGKQRPLNAVLKQIIQVQLHKDFEPFVNGVGVRCMYPSIAWSEHGLRDESKVQLSWEGHKIKKKIHFEKSVLKLISNVKKSGSFFQNILAFSEYLNFIERHDPRLSFSAFLLSPSCSSAFLLGGHSLTTLTRQGAPMGSSLVGSWYLKRYADLHDHSKGISSPMHTRRIGL